MSKGAPTMTMSAAASLEASSKQVGLYGRWAKVVSPKYLERVEISTSSCSHTFDLYCSCCGSCIENGRELEARLLSRRMTMIETKATTLLAIAEDTATLEAGVVEKSR